MSTLNLKVNRRIETVEGSSTLAITAKAKELKSQGHDVVNFAAGEPDFDTPESIKKAAIKAIESGATKYTPSVGTLELREKIARKFQNDNGLIYHPSQIAVSCGAKHSLFNIIQVLVDEGDEVLFSAPYWVSYPEMVKIAGGTSRIIETSQESGFKITPRQLQENITEKTRLLILNSPSNPTGVLYSREDLAALAEVIVKNNIFVISDEIYEELIYDVKEYTSLASLGKEIFDLTFTVNGVSKAYSMTGWRIGYAAGPKEVMEYVKKLQDHSTSCPSSISQAAAAAALDLPKDDIAKMRDQFHARRDLMMKLLDGIPEISYIRPGGAFYMFCNISKLGEAFDVASRILNDVKVAFIPGEGFGAPGFARLSFATSEAKIEDGIRRIAAWIKENK